MTITRRLAALGASAAVAVLAVMGFAPTASASPATITVNPGSVAQGVSFTVSGEYCEPQRDHPSTVYVTVDDSLSTSATPDGDGLWSVEIDSSTLSPGTYPVYATCDAYQFDYEYAPGSVTITSPTTTTVTSTVTSTVTTSSASTVTSTSAACRPTLNLIDYPGSVAQGHTVHVQVTCYRPGETLQVVLHSSPIVLTTLIADSSGNASGTATIPLDAVIGAHTITVVGELSGISLEAPIEVVAAAETTASAPLTLTPVVQTITTNLASTGVDAAAMTVWGVVLLMAGGIAITLTRKRGGRHVGN
jgi:hypothetical protein